MTLSFWKRKQAAVDAAAPLPTDPKLTELQKALADAEEPVRPWTPILCNCVRMPKRAAKQRKNTRLTVVQDLAWALINSPGFLFNH